MKARVATFLILLLASWCVMTVVHELGHIVGGWLAGATLQDFDLAPWRLPYSLHSPDPHPRLTLWAGPILGVVVPTIVAAILRHRFAWFVADFCLIANGGYLAVAWFSGEPMLDTARLLAAGVSPLFIAAYCLPTIFVGYFRFRTDCIAILKTDRSGGRVTGDN